VAEPGKRHPARLRYRRRTLVGSAVYIAAATVATWLIPDDAPPSVGSIALAIAASAGVLTWIWAMARFLIEIDDEYQRMLQVRAILVATGLTLAVTSMWGMVELFTTAPRLPVFFVFPIWCLGLAVGGLFNKLTTGDTGESC
jgi:MFS family permease